MLLRRITQNVKDQNWTAIALDFVIVVTGVFLGIQLGDWNNEAALEREEARYLQQLSTEFHSVEDTLESQVADYERFLFATHQALKIVRSDGPVNEAEASQAFLTFASGRLPPVSPPTLQELISSGKVDLIDDFALRTELMSAHARFDQAARIFELIRPTLNDAQAPFYAHIEYGIQSDPTQAVRLDDISVPTRGNIDIGALRADPEVESGLEVFLLGHSNMLKVEIAALEHVSQLNAMLSAELEERQ